MTRNHTVAARIAYLLDAMRNCEKSGNAEWYSRHHDRLAAVLSESPSGSGWDCGTTLQVEKCNASRLVFTGSFHHMNEVGMYDGWTDHTVTARPSFDGRVDVTMSGRDRNQMKDYMVQLFSGWLDSNAGELV
jgi:hypothetical protein